MKTNPPRHADTIDIRSETECPVPENSVSTTDSRKAMLRAMVTYLFENGKIETTVTRAKEVRSMAEKMVTLGKQEDLHAKRQVYCLHHQGRCRQEGHRRDRPQVC